MLKKLFNRLAGRTENIEQQKTSSESVEETFLRQIAMRSHDDPLIGAKVGAEEITHQLMSAMTTEHGVHIESLLCALGSLAGYSCQAALRAKALAEGKNETAYLVEAQCKNGKVYYLGDALNGLLAESHYSVWGIAAGGAQTAGCSTLLELDEIFKYVIGTMGSETFGHPRLPPEHPIHDTPENYVNKLWPKFAPSIVKYCPNPEHWPVLLGIAVQKIIIQGKDTIDPSMSLRIVMESAIPMSKIEREV